MSRHIRAHPRTSAHSRDGTDGAGAPGDDALVARLHPDQVGTDAALVRRLLSEQFPQWAALPLEPLRESGTDHDVYRLGAELSVRLPKIGWAAGQAPMEAAWLPRLAPQLPVAVPVVAALGQPGAGYPFGWSVQEWLPGERADPADDDSDALASDIATFLTALHRIDPAGAPPRDPDARGGPLATGDEQVRDCLAQLAGRLDAATALERWQESLAAPPWDGGEVWVHGDLLPGNLLVRGGRLAAVIDFGALTVGDPACDLLPAWNLFSGPRRRQLRADLQASDGIDEADWLRGRGWALRQALVALPYYWDTHPGIRAQALRAVGEVLADNAASAS
jgi:aminoglycoside phosphotransferase (APT) family kinase protein